MKTFRRFISGTLSLLMVCGILFGAAPAVSAADSGENWKTFEELAKEKGYINGIQQPWFTSGSLGNDIGKAVRDGYKATNFDESMFYEVFTNSKAMGFDIVKIWLTYQNGGIMFDDGGHVVGIEPTFKENLPRVFEIAEECGVYICITAVSHFTDATYCDGKYTHDELSQFLYNEDETKLFIDNFLKPVIEITKDYPNVIMCDVFCEPEANGGKWGLQVGTSWENIVKFMTTVNKTVKEVNPRLATFASASVSLDYITDGSYSDIGLDCYGFDYYNDYGTAPDVSELFLDAPFVYGEVGTESSRNTDDTYMSSFVSNYLTTAAENGVKAGFYWYYGFNTSLGQSVVDSSNKLRSYTLAFRSWALDNEYSKTGYEGIDKPAMMYSTSEAIRWFGSRGAELITLQRSEDGVNWQTVLSFDPSDSNAAKAYEFASMMYEYTDENLEQGKTYYYRAAAQDEAGNKVYSDSTEISVEVVTCSEEDNLIKNNSFEAETVETEGGWIVHDQAGPFNMTHITDGTAGDTTYSGSGSLYQITRVWQPVTLKPNTDYTLTFYYKFVQNPNLGSNQGYYNVFCGTLVNFPKEDTDKDPLGYFLNGPTDRIQIPNKFKDGQWHRYTVKFNSGNFTDISIGFSGWNGGSSGTDPNQMINWYLDDIYLFESK